MARAPRRGASSPSSRRSLEVKRAVDALSHSGARFDASLDFCQKPLYNRTGNLLNGECGWIPKAEFVIVCNHALFVLDCSLFPFSFVDWLVFFPSSSSCLFSFLYIVKKGS